MTTDHLFNITGILTMLKRVNVSVSRNTFYRWLASGYFPPADYVLGRSKRWTERSIKQWLTQCVQDARA